MERQQGPYCSGNGVSAGAMLLQQLRVRNKLLLHQRSFSDKMLIDYSKGSSSELILSRCNKRMPPKSKYNAILDGPITISVLCITFTIFLFSVNVLVN